MTTPTNASSAAELKPLAAGSTGWIRSTVYTALFGALFIAFSSISVPLGFSPIPITLQTLAVMLAGGLLGPWRGFWSLTVVIALTATGLPLLNGHGGLAVLYGPTGGYIWMFPFAALLIGWVSDLLFRQSDAAYPRKLSPLPYIVLAIAVFVGGALLVYAGGVPWLAHKAGVSFAKAMSLGCYPFLLGDTIKTVVATILIGALRPLVPGLRPSPRPAKRRLR